jgi:hypothetical protein
LSACPRPRPMTAKIGKYVIPARFCILCLKTVWIAKKRFYIGIRFFKQGCSWRSYCEDREKGLDVNALPKCPNREPE